MHAGLGYGDKDHRCASVVRTMSRMRSISGFDEVISTKGVKYVVLPSLQLTCLHFSAMFLRLLLLLSSSPPLPSLSSLLARRLLAKLINPLPSPFIHESPVVSKPCDALCRVVYVCVCMAGVIRKWFCYAEKNKLIWQICCFQAYFGKLWRGTK